MLKNQGLNQEERGCELLTAESLQTSCEPGSSGDGCGVETQDGMGEPAAQMVIKLGYRGAGFAGFAKQPGIRTVQQEVEQALEVFLRRPVETTCAGRTDSGVHAQGQYVSLPVYGEELQLKEKRILSALSALVGDDISIKQVYRAAPDFSARFSAVARHYRYRIYPHHDRPILAWTWAWWLRQDLDVDAMQEGARYLLGELDFKSFCKAISAVEKPTHRYVSSLEVSRVQEAGEEMVIIDICGNAFLHSMVRTITGTLVEVGRGHRSCQWVQQVQQACDRKAAGPCAPAHGLVFVDVDYPEGALKLWESH